MNALAQPLAQVIPLRPAAFPDRVRAIFRDVLPAAWPGYAARSGQLAMVDAVSACLDAGGALMADAPCGTGKSLAYLIPAILRARATGRPAIVATATIALQEQLVAKDLPALARALDLPGGPLRFALLKGRGNYLCHATLDEARPTYLGADEHEELDAIDRWARTTETGDRAELPLIVRDGVWNLRAKGTDDCLRDGCDHYEDCHARAAKARAEGADVIVVNMHLLAAHIAVHMEMWQDAVLPRTGPRESEHAWDTVILDEAHELGDIAREFFGCELTERKAAHMARWVREHDHALADAIEREAGAFFADLDTRIPLDARGKPEPVRIREGIDTDALCAALRAASAIAAKVARAIEPRRKAGLATRDEIKVLRRAESAKRRATRVVSWMEAAACPAQSPEVVLWAEAAQGKRGRFPVLQGRHIDPGPILAAELWARARAVVATSATLTTGAGPDGWHWIRRQLGAPGSTRTLSVASPFDFAAQARLCLPRCPDPRSDREGFDRAVCDVLAEVARGALAHGGVLGLFTSRRMSDAAAEACRGAGLPRVLAQGEQPRAELVAAMRTGPAVLCGTASLWTGVDLQGDACVAVVIDKLPFAPPGDPVMDAIAEQLAARTGDKWAAFREEQLPRAVLQLRQGVGRLIRASGDRGVVVLCDPRLTSARYGADVLRALGLPVRVGSVPEAVTWLATGLDTQGRLL